MRTLEESRAIAQEAANEEKRVYIVTEDDDGDFWIWWRGGYHPARERIVETFHPEKGETE